MPYSETELISEIQKRNTAAFEHLVRTYTKPVYYLAYNILNIGNSKEDIEECVSDVFVDAWSKIDSYDPAKGSFRKWLLMLTKYKALSYKRKLQSQPVEYLEDYAFDEPVDGATPLLDREAQQAVLETIQTFSEMDRQLFVRRYFFDEPISALMQSTGLTRAAIDNRLLRSRNKIKEALFCG